MAYWLQCLIILAAALLLLAIAILSGELLFLWVMIILILGFIAFAISTGATC